jgi:WD40 repeat protein
VLVLGGGGQVDPGPGPDPRPVAEEAVPKEPGPAPGIAGADAAAAPDEDRPRQLWAVVVGIERYANGIPACDGAVADAVAVRDWLVDQAGWPRENVQLLIDSGAELPGPGLDPARGLRPTRLNLSSAIRRWLPSRARPEDLVVVYFAGHATHVPADPDDPNRPHGNSFLLPIDANPGEVERTGLVLDEALDDLASDRDNPIVLWLDTSLAGRGRPPIGTAAGVDGDGAPGPPSSAPWLDRLARWPGVSAWLAADRRVAAGAPEPGRRSPFTAALLDGLDGAGPSGTMLDVLARMQADPAVLSQGFRVRGGLLPGLGLRPGTIPQLLKAGPREPVLQQGHGTALTALRFSADGDRLITVARGEASIKLWDVPSDRVLRVIDRATNGVTALATRPEDRGLLVFGDGNGYLHAIDLDDPEPDSPEPPNLGGAVAGLAILPGGDRLAVIFNDERTGASPAFLRSVDEPSGPGRQLSRRASALIPGPIGADWGFVLADLEHRTLLLHDREGRAVRSIPSLGGRIGGVSSAASGALLAAADDEGGLIVLDSTTWEQRLRLDLGAPADRLALSPTGRLAVALASEIRVFDLAAEGPAGLDPVAIPIDRPLADLALSPDGTWLAACPNFEADRGDPPQLWRLGGSTEAEPTALARNLPPADGEAEAARPSGSAASVAFSPDGATLVAGDTLGGLRRWSLSDRSIGLARPPRRGQVAELSISGDGRELLQITRDGVALSWDLRDGRGPRTIPGSWASGVVLPGTGDGDPPRLALSGAPAASSPEVVLFDARSGARLLGFEPPRGEDGEVIPHLAFSGLVASADGRLVAGCTPDDQVVAVWEADSGSSVLAIDGAHFPPRAVDLSADGRLLLTAGDDGARLWETTGPTGDRPRERAFIEILDDEQAPIPVVSARLRPDPEGEGGGPIRVALGLQDGQVRLWTEGGPDGGVRLDRMRGAAEAVAFSGDGRWLAAGGVDRMIRLWDMAGGDPVPGPFPSPGRGAVPGGGSHAEQINTLAFVRDHPVFISGGDDGLMRFWSADPGGGRLLGSVSTDQDSAQWVAFTPDGLFDCSPAGADRLWWRWGEGLVPMAGYPANHRVVGLAGRLGSGDQPEPPGAIDREPPSLAIEGPAGPVVSSREVELVLWLDDDRPESIRVYQDGVPVLATERDDRGEVVPNDRLRPDPDGEQPRRWLARVRLHSGPNRFYAMTGRAIELGDRDDDEPSPAPRPDGYSEEIELAYEGDDPDVPGRVHVIALGVGDYDDPARALRFATRDAETFAAFLRGRGAQVEGELGRCHILTDRQVSPRAIGAAFEDLRRATRGRPQDTVVLFLAGHADALGPEDRQKFFLILPGFPFDESATTREHAVRVAMANRGELLPFGAIYAGLFQLDALKRIIVVDACQAGAVRSDESVRRIRQLVDDAAFRARTSYFLAAPSQDIPAGESPELGHGLLTYAMLRGLGMPPGSGPGRLPVVSGLPGLDELANADRWPVNGYVTTGELRRFVDRAMPMLAARFPDLALRAGVDGLPGPDPDASPPTVGLADAGFTLLRLPDGPAPPSSVPAEE